MVGGNARRSLAESSTPISSTKPLSPEAQRALAEAEARRAMGPADRPVEIDGRGDLEPVRYGDWEVKGLASDF